MSADPMELDWQVCSHARLSRDSRFDGKFYIGVRTSGVYCRPICPAPTAKESNVHYFATAAAAAEAGFRPCLRCRPECSPGTPAWAGTSNTVSRALRLIAEGALDQSSMEIFAAHLGVGPRHLRRLFVHYLGAPPSAVAHTRRLQFAKKLIDETDLPMVQVALASGFGCVRRFNSAIQANYQRTPSRLRYLARHLSPGNPNEYTFRLNYRPPYAWRTLLNFLALHAIPGVESVDANAYRRTISVENHDGWFAVSPHEKDKDALSLRLQIGEPRLLFSIVERIRAMFDLNADWQAIVKRLRKSADLAESVRRNPGLRVPGSWNGFELTVRAILNQHHSLDAATNVASRIAQTFGRRICGAGELTHLFPAAGILASVDLSSVGLSTGHAGTIQRLARAVADGEIRFEAVIDVKAFLSQLCSVPGVSLWTAQYVAMRALGEPDAFPVSDATLVPDRGAESLEEKAEAWRPWRAYAAMYLWNMDATLNRRREPDNSP